MITKVEECPVHNGEVQGKGGIDIITSDPEYPISLVPTEDQAPTAESTCISMLVQDHTVDIVAEARASAQRGGPGVGSEPIECRDCSAVLRVFCRREIVDQPPDA